MAKHLPVQARARRAVHYIDTVPQTTHVVLLTAAQMEARRREQQALYARWAARQAAIAERDRKARRFWLGFGAIVGTAVLAGVVVLGWLVWHAIVGVGAGLLALPILVVVGAGVVLGGHRCVTVVQHWH